MTNVVVFYTAGVPRLQGSHGESRGADEVSREEGALTVKRPRNGTRVSVKRPRNGTRVSIRPLLFATRLCRLPAHFSTASAGSLSTQLLSHHSDSIITRAWNIPPFGAAAGSVANQIAVSAPSDGDCWPRSLPISFEFKTPTFLMQPF